jgi:sigma-B regulation protein RsbU (phosphoserine phosphatase)
LIREIIEIAFLLFFYLISYFLLKNILHIPDIIDISIILFIVLTLNSSLKKFIRQLIHRKFYLFITRVERVLNDFNNKLNRIVDYHELLEEYYKLFKIIFHSPVWAFYVFEQSSFRLIKSETGADELKLPDEIHLTNHSKNEMLIDLNSYNIINPFSPPSDLHTFLAFNLDMLIVIEGKSQVIALLFTNHKNFIFLKNKSTRELFYRIMKKSGQILENTALYLDVLQKNLEIKKLFEVSEKILSTLSTDQILTFLLDALNAVISFDAAAIFLFDPQTKKLNRKIGKGYGKDADLTLKLGEGACGWVVENKQISLIEDTADSKHYYPARSKTRSQVALPLHIQDEVLGVICLESNEPRHFTNSSIELLNIFANQAAIALNNAKQYEISLVKQSLEDELLNASKVQGVLLPSRPPTNKDLHIAFANIPSKIVSGDLFDFVKMEENQMGLMIGDVSGKGAGAAIMMSLVLAGFRAYKRRPLTVCERIARLNNLLYESFSTGKYATIFYGIISTDLNQLTYTNAGHNPPILFRSDGTIEKLTDGGIVLGYLQDEMYIQKTISFHQGDCLLCYTDGVTEALNEQDQEYGEERLIAIIRENMHLNSFELKDNLIKDIKKFIGIKDQSDDITLIIVKHV